jgi:hypothetical protein
METDSFKRVIAGIYIISRLMQAKKYPSPEEYFFIDVQILKT